MRLIDADALLNTFNDYCATECAICHYYKEEKSGGHLNFRFSEKLPNRNGVYMVTRIIDGTRITDACYFDGQNTWHRDTGINHGRPYLTDIIAWQYKPDPYRKGGAEE